MASTKTNDVLSFFRVLNYNSRILFVNGFLVCIARISNIYRNYQAYNMKFPHKLWSLVNECTSGAIGWGIDGDTIFIDYCKFEMEYLSTSRNIFKTKHVVSFVRQLNLYGFRKCSRVNDTHEFRNPYFIRGRNDLVKLMKRKLGSPYDFDIINKTEKMEGLKLRGKNKKLDSDFQNKKPTDGNPQLGSSMEGITNFSAPFGYANFPKNHLQDLNSLPCGWWGNAYNSYYQMNMNSLYSPNSNPLNSEIPSSIKEEPNGTASKKNDISYWKNLEMCNNVIFVPVPAQYGLYPGYFNGNMPMVFPLPTQPEETNGSKPQV